MWQQGGGSFGDGGKSVAVDSTGNVAVGGKFIGTINFGGGSVTSAALDGFLASYSSAGTFRWARGISSTGSDFVNGVAVDGAGGVAATGVFSGPSIDLGGGAQPNRGGNDILLAKYSSAGVWSWSKTLGGPGAEAGNAIASTATGDTIAGGYYSSGADMGGGVLPFAGSVDAFVTRYSPTGAHIWTRTLNGASEEQVTTVAVDTGGNVYAAGVFTGSVDLGFGDVTSAGAHDSFLIKYAAASGVPIWAYRFGSTGDDWVRAIAIDTRTGDVLLTGQFTGTIDFGGPPLTSAGYEDIFLAKLNGMDGSHLWSKRFGSSSAPDYGYGVAVDGSGNVAITGFFAGQADFGGGAILAQVYDIFVAKYDSAGGYLWFKRYGDPPGLFDSQYGDAIAMGSSGTIFLTGHFVGTLDFGSAGRATSIFAGGSDGYLYSEEIPVPAGASATTILLAGVVALGLAGVGYVVYRNGVESA